MREPPSYNEKDSASGVKRTGDGKGITEASPPNYADVEKEQKTAPKEDIVHHLHHPRDTIQSLSLSYNIPASVLRSYNNLSSDNLLLARHTILIPASHYQGSSLSTEPQVDADEDERRKKTRRFMVTCKVSEYDVAVLYLQQADWDMDKATEAWMEDERWEREHPIKPQLGKDGLPKGKGKMSEVWKRRFTGGRAEKQ